MLLASKSIEYSTMVKYSIVNHSMVKYSRVQYSMIQQYDRWHISVRQQATLYLPPLTVRSRLDSYLEFFHRHLSTPLGQLIPRTVQKVTDEVALKTAKLRFSKPTTFPTFFRKAFTLVCRCSGANE